MRLLSTFFLVVVLIILVVVASSSLLVVSAFRRDEHPEVGNGRAKQSEIDGLQHELVRKMQELEEQYAQKKVPILQERNKFLASVPGFWKRAITSHPNFGQIAFGGDAKMLDALTNLEVEEIHEGNNKLPDGTELSVHHSQATEGTATTPKYLLRMTFGPNDYFADTILWRLVDPYSRNLNVAKVSGVSWKHLQRPTHASLFQFFERPGDNVAGGRHLDIHRVLDVAHLLRYEIFANPFTYYDIPTYADLAAEDARRREELVRQRDEEELMEQYARQDAEDNAREGL